MAGNEHCICRYSDGLFSDVQCTRQFACIFSDWDRGVKTKCLILLRVKCADQDEKSHRVWKLTNTARHRFSLGKTSV